LKHKEVGFEFVESIPEKLNNGVLYISTKYATAIHKCCCGCGNEVVTPLSPAQWSISFDGETVSLEPSIGNWTLPCRSHYWITRSKAKAALPWSQKRIEAGRDRDNATLKKYFDRKKRKSSD
jgi:hypothetical protein